MFVYQTSEWRNQHFLLLSIFEGNWFLILFNQCLCDTLNFCDDFMDPENHSFKCLPIYRVSIYLAIYALAEIKPQIEVQTEMSFFLSFFCWKLRYVIHGSTVWVL